MPGGYGTSGPWGSAGETYSQPEPSWQPSGGHPGGWASEPSQTFSTPPQVTTPIVDVAANQDAIDDAVAMANVAPDVYTSPKEIYPWLSDETADWTNVSQVGGGPNTPGSLLHGVDLESYGFNSKSEYLPKEFLEMLFEGSVVGGGEYAQSSEPNIGTWDMVESGMHPLFPGGQEDYYAPFGNIQGEDYYAPSEGAHQQQYGYGDPGGGGSTGGGPGGWLDVKMFSRGRPENIHPYWRDIAGTSMLPVAGSGAGGSLAAADELYALASGKKAFSSTPEEQGILALLNA